MNARQINTIGKTMKHHVRQKGTFGLALLSLIQVYGEKAWNYFTTNNKTVNVSNVQKSVDSLKTSFVWHCSVNASDRDAQVKSNDEIKQLVNQANQNIFLMLNK